jgi:hypothetical protein
MGERSKRNGHIQIGRLEKMMQAKIKTKLYLTG